MKKSILQENLKKCWVCGSAPVHTHEVFYGSANRAKSLKHGMVVALCPKHHNMSNEGVHFNKKLDLSLKQHAQTKFEEKHSRDEFIKIFGRNYL